MTLHKIAVLMACIISTPALAWSSNGGNFEGSVTFGGSVKPEDYTSLWQWRVGDALKFQSSWEHMNVDKTGLTITVDSPKGLLYGETIKAMTAYSASMGIAPQISFSGYDNQPVYLNQEESDANGKGHINLPIKNNDEKIGTLKVNVTAAAIGVGRYNNSRMGLSVKATDKTHPLYGGLFPRPITQALNGSDSANNTVSRFGGKPFNDIAVLLQAHPNFEGLSWGGNSVAPGAGYLLSNGYFQDNLMAASYALGIDADQTLEATFDKPIASTTEWSAPLNIAVTYN